MKEQGLPIPGLGLTAGSSYHTVADDFQLNRHLGMTRSPKGVDEKFFDFYKRVLEEHGPVLASGNLTRPAGCFIRPEDVDTVFGHCVLVTNVNKASLPSIMSCVSMPCGA